MARMGIEGVGILEVHRGSSAEEAGLKEVKRLRDGRIEMGDVIIGCDGSPVKKNSDLIRILDRHEVGEEVELNIFRKGRKILIRMVLQTVG
jgi:S1-C subfamily serine protease